MLARRDAALDALAAATSGSGGDYLAQIERGTGARRARLLELELELGLDSPPALQAQRLALQVKRLKERFNSAAAVTAGTAAERLLQWCAQPGVTDADDRERSARVFSKIAATGGP